MQCDCDSKTIDKTLFHFQLYGVLAKALIIYFKILINEN